ncbi:MAG: hypothetical protein Q8L39_09710, partial [Burkholderiales bacterium]|nr:hypothetical protein [Burkholderiales bacterium]
MHFGKYNIPLWVWHSHNGDVASGADFVRFGLRPILGIPQRSIAAPFHEMVQYSRELRAIESSRQRFRSKFPYVPQSRVGHTPVGEQGGGRINADQPYVDEQLRKPTEPRTSLSIA